MIFFDKYRAGVLLSTILVLLSFCDVTKGKEFEEAPDYAKTNAAVMRMMAFAKAYNPVDIALGAPNFGPPEFLRQAFINVSLSPDYAIHQYGRSEGHPRLVTILSKIYSPLLNRKLDAFDNFVVSIGATNAIFSALQSLTHPDDEWIVFVPHWEHYASMLKMSGAKIREVLLRPGKDINPCKNSTSSPDWTFDRKQMRNAFTKKTKGILLNNPNNPTGKVFDREELMFIADLVKKHDVIALVDEVYEWLVYDGNKHIRFASLPGMFERTITVSAASKAFSVTGWRIGWAYGPAYLMNYMKKSIYGAAGDNVTPNQVAVAMGLERVFAERGHANSYFVEYPKLLTAKRDRMVDALCKAGFVPHVPHSGFFLLADWTKMKTLPDYLVRNATNPRRDIEFVKYLVKEVGLEVYPGTPYYGDEHQPEGRDFVRICFVKTDETLDKAVEILTNL